MSRWDLTRKKTKTVIFGLKNPILSLFIVEKEKAEEKEEAAKDEEEDEGEERKAKDDL